MGWGVNNTFALSCLLLNTNDFTKIFTRRDSSRAEFTPLGEDHATEYYFASDASAIVEHTNRVIYLEVRIKIFSYIIQLFSYHQDDDVAAVSDGGNLTIHRIR